MDKKKISYTAKLDQAPVAGTYDVVVGICRYATVRDEKLFEALQRNFCIFPSGMGITRFRRSGEMDRTMWKTQSPAI